MNVGIVQMDGRPPRRPSSNKNYHHSGAGAVPCYSGMAAANQPALLSGTSSEGVGRGRCSRVSFNRNTTMGCPKRVGSFGSSTRFQMRKVVGK
jgi:hypothetical protein